MKRPTVFDESHILWPTFINFHSGKLTQPVQREAAKALLFPIHYGDWDTGYAFDQAAKARVEGQ